MDSTQNIKRLKFGITDVFLEDIAPSEGKITISNSYGKNYSAWWGAMGGNISDFMTKINEDYFTSNLMGGRRSTHCFCPKKTFANLRKFIKTEAPSEMAWYEYLDFQKHFREELNLFQQECTNEYYFIELFKSKMQKLDYNLIDFWLDRKYIKEFLEGICEPWDFLGDRLSEDAIFLMDLHKKIKKELLEKAK